jgi:ubiquinone/menaquinone biosynthesis C-methylase UbiE
MNFAEHYKDFYRPGDVQQYLWRSACAIEKAANIVTVWPIARESLRPIVVDIGCGDGAIAAELARLAFFRRLEGFDVSHSGIAIARDREVPETTFATYDGGRLPADDQTYDLAIVSHVIEHVEEPRVLLREAARVARWVVVEVPLERNTMLRGDFRWTDTGHINFYDAVLIRQLIQSCGLTVAIQRVTNPGRAWARVVSSRKLLTKWALKECLLRSVRPLAMSLLTYHGVVLARSSSST